MNFMQFLQSLDDFLYEVMSWLVFYPITLWRTVRHPLAMMSYADAELADDEDQQYTDTLAPPLFLLISLLISQGLELAVVGGSPLIGETSGLDALIRDETSLLILRLLTLSVFPLVIAVRLVRAQQIGLNRDTLRPPFYSQCFVAAPFVLMGGFAGTAVQLGHLWAALGPAALALIWYGIVQARWFMAQLQIGEVAATWTACVAIVQALAMAAAIGLLFA